MVLPVARTRVGRGRNRVIRGQLKGFRPVCRSKISHLPNGFSGGTFQSTPSGCRCGVHVGLAMVRIRRNK